MLVQEKLLNAYAERGYEVVTGSGFAPGCSIWQEFTSIRRDGQPLGTGLGMSFTELAVLEMLAELWEPRTVYGVGVAFGWSSLALRLFFPKARMAFLDAGVEGADNLAGIRLTQELLDAHGGGAVVHGFSPQQTPEVVESHLGGRINLAFVDGLHTNAQQTLDFEGLQPYLDQDHVVLFHDVRLCSMQESFAGIAAAYGERAVVFRRTTSGIGAVWSRTMQYRMGRLATLFQGEPVKPG